MGLPQIIMMVVFLGVVVFFVVRSKGMAAKGAAALDFRPSLAALRAGAAANREPGESEPVCVVAYHYSGFSAQPVVVGVTERHIFVVKGTSPMMTFPYDYEGEHYSSKEKTKQRKGFFDWSHGDCDDGTKGYSPKVKVAPFAGEEWRMYPTMEGFPEQKDNLREFSDRFYFQWFYD